MNVLAFVGKNGGNLGENIENDWGKTRGEYGEILGQIRERNTIDDILRQSGVHTSHLLQWTTHLSYGSRNYAHKATSSIHMPTYYTYAKARFLVCFNCILQILPFGTYGTYGT